MNDRILTLQVLGNVDQLKMYTDLTQDQLWAAGFDLDDLDVIFVSDARLHRTGEPDEDWDGEDIVEAPGLPAAAHWTARMLFEQPRIMVYHEYEGRHYYMIYHA